MPAPHSLAKVVMVDPAANRWADQLLAVLNPILRNVNGDLRGPVSAPEVVGWLGLPLSATMATPSIGQVPKWNGIEWEPGSAGSTGTVTAVTATAPLASSGGTTPDISITGSPAGGVAYATGLTLAYCAAATAGIPLVSGGTGAPSFAAIDLAQAGTVTGILPIARGGTNTNATPTAGAVPYGTGSAYAFSSVGAVGQFATSGGTGALTWTTPSAATTGAGLGAYRATTTTPDTVALTDYTLDVTTTGSFTVNLPTAGSGAGQAANGRVFVVKNSGGAMVTVAPQGSQTIDGASSFMIVTQYAAFSFLSTGSNWVLV